MYATAASLLNRKAPNTHIRPSIHIWATAVTVKALRTEGRKRQTAKEQRQTEKERKTLSKVTRSVWKTPADPSTERRRYNETDVAIRLFSVKNC